MNAILPKTPLANDAVHYNLFFASKRRENKNKYARSKAGNE